MYWCYFRTFILYNYLLPPQKKLKPNARKKAPSQQVAE